MHLPSTSGALVVVGEVVVGSVGGSVGGSVFVKTSGKVIAATMSRTAL